MTLNNNHLYNWAINEKEHSYIYITIFIVLDVLNTFSGGFPMPQPYASGYPSQGGGQTGGSCPCLTHLFTTVIIVFHCTDTMSM